MFQQQKFRNPVPVIRNPPRGIQNPRLSWIPLHWRGTILQEACTVQTVQEISSPSTAVNSVLQRASSLGRSGGGAGNWDWDKSDSSVHGEPQGRWSSNSRDVVAIGLRKHPFLLALRRAKRPQRRRARRNGCFRRLLKLQLQALLPFPATPPQRPGELAHRLLILPLTVEFHDYKKG